jgi:hypothetical protein
MAEAITSAIAEGATRLRVLCYAGNYVRRTLENIPQHKLRDLRVEVLTRNPRSNWNHPPTASQQCRVRKNDIERMIDAFENSGHFRELAQRDHSGGAARYVRFYDAEPTARVLLADLPNGRRLIAIGMYRLEPRREGTPDFTGTDSPVVELLASTSQSAPLINEFAQWFDFMWQLNAPRHP